MTCDGLPNPGLLSDMNTFLFLWSLEDELATMDTIEEKCRVIIHVSNIYMFQFLIYNYD